MNIRHPTDATSPLFSTSVMKLQQVVTSVIFSKQIFILLLLGVASVSCGSETQKSSEVSGVVPAPQSSSSSVISSQSVSSAQPTGPEPRQISSSSGSSGSSFPYSLYQNAILSSALPQTASSSGSWLSILRPSQGGRRASLTSRLRNIMNAIFR